MAKEFIINYGLKNCTNKYSGKKCVTGFYKVKANSKKSAITKAKKNYKKDLSESAKIMRWSKKVQNDIFKDNDFFVQE